MSVSASTVPAVKTKLFELFTAAVNTETTEVWSATPNEDHAVAENVYIGQVRGRREFRTLGPPSMRQREETYSVSVLVEVYREGTDIKGCEERLFEIVAALEKAVAENKELGLTGVIGWSIVGEFSQETAAAKEGVLSSMPFQVQVEARI